MKVDILCEFGSINGGENSMLAVLPLLREHDAEIRLIAPPVGPLAERIRSLDFELIPFETEHGDSLSKRQELLARILWKISPKLLHANSLSMSRLSGPVVESMRIPSIGHLRDIIRLNQTVVTDLNRHRRILAVSEATRQFHVTQGLHSNISHVVYNGVDLNYFRPKIPTGYLHQELDLSVDAFFLGAVGQIGLRKGHDFLLDALEILFESQDNVHLLVAGCRWSEKEESLRFEQNIIKRSITEPFLGRVHFLGVRNDIPKLLNELTLLLHPARQEPLGRVMLEAAACGTSVVATDVGGTSEIFPDSRFDLPIENRFKKESARLVPLKSPDLFRAAVCSLLDSAADRDRIGKAARQRVERMFSHKIAADNLFRHYEAVFNGE